VINTFAYYDAATIIAIIGLKYRTQSYNSTKGNETCACTINMVVNEDSSIFNK
jgi:hypothetical protein